MWTTHKNRYFSKLDEINKFFLLSNAKRRDRRSNLSLSQFLAYPAWHRQTKGITRKQLLKPKKSIISFWNHALKWAVREICSPGRRFPVTIEEVELVRPLGHLRITPVIKYHDSNPDKRCLSGINSYARDTSQSSLKSHGPRFRIFSLEKSPLYNDVYFNISLADWQSEQRALQVLLISSLQKVNTLRVVIQTGCSLLWPIRTLWKRKCGRRNNVLVHISAWYTALHPVHPEIDIVYRPCCWKGWVAICCVI